VAEEIRDPNRNVSRALALGAGAVIAIYLLLNLVYLVVIPVGELAHIGGSVLDVIADRMLGATAGAVMGAVSIVSLAASISAMTFAGPRVYFAMARDGLFFANAARVHSRYRTPAAAIVAQAVWSAVLVLTATAQALVTYTGFAIILFSGVAIVALFVLRRREASLRPPSPAWGYPVAPALYVGVSVLILLNALYRTPLQTGAGVAIIAAGVPVYAARRRWTRRTPAAQQE
jgi:APA family basic amino acid/polyamine antiporter